MDVRWVWPVMALALIGTLWAPVGTKSVHAAQCNGDWQNYQCSHTHYDADYELLRLDVETRTYESPGYEPREGGVTEDRRWAYGEAPHPDGITPMLELGGWWVLLSAMSMPLAGYAMLARPLQSTRYVAYIAYGNLTAAVAAWSAGMAWHAFTWRGVSVDPLLPGWGMALVFVALLSGMPLLPDKERDAMPALPEAGA